jgi:hypothetical protein
MADLLKDAIKSAMIEVLAERSERPESPSQTGPRLMRVTAAAEYLDCTPPHIHNLIARGVLIPIRWPNADGSPGRTIWIDRADLDRAIEEAKRNHAA